MIYDGLHGTGERGRERTRTYDTPTEEKYRTRGVSLARTLCVPPPPRRSASLGTRDCTVCNTCTPHISYGAR
jgi:hypothetical protein